MLDKLKKTLQEASDMLREQAGALGEGAKEKGYQVIEEWLTIFPKLELAGLEVTSFALSVALSPGLEVDLRGKHADFSPERLQLLLDEHRQSTMMVSVLNTIKTTYAMHRRTLAPLQEPLLVKVRIRLSPEIRVVIGKPML